MCALLCSDSENKSPDERDTIVCRRVAMVIPALISDSRWGSLEWIVSNDMLRKVSDEAAWAYVLPELNPHNIAFLQFTSGSTSDPKGVMVTLGGLLHNCHLCILTFGFDVYLEEVESLTPRTLSKLKLENFADKLFAAHRKSYQRYNHRIRCFSWLPVYHDMG